LICFSLVNGAASSAGPTFTKGFERMLITDDSLEVKFNGACGVGTVLIEAMGPGDSVTLRMKDFTPGKCASALN
jgi:hypothetical protein